MLTRQLLSELWASNDLIALGRHADAVRKRLHPYGIVSYAVGECPDCAEKEFPLTGNIEQRLDSLAALREQQERDRNLASIQPLIESNATGVEYLKTLALCRLCLDNVCHIQGTCKLFGLKVAQLSLRFGANDLGLADGHATEEELRRLIRNAGFVPKQRDALFRTYSIN